MRKGTATAGQYIEGSQRVAQYCIDRETFMARNAELQKQLREFEEWRDSPEEEENAAS